MRECLSLHESVGTAWSSLAGAGTLLRLEERPPLGRDELFAAWMADPTDAQAKHLPACSWAAAWTPEDAATARTLVESRATDLLITLSELRQSYSPDRAAWRAAVVQALEDREELEGAWLLIRWAHGGEEPETLRMLDEAGYAFADLLVPTAESRASVPLSRAGVFDFDAWWVESAT